MLNLLKALSIRKIWKRSAVALVVPQGDSGECYISLYSDSRKSKFLESFKVQYEEKGSFKGIKQKYELVGAFIILPPSYSFFTKVKEGKVSSSLPYEESKMYYDTVDVVDDESKEEVLVSSLKDNIEKIMNFLKAQKIILLGMQELSISLSNIFSKDEYLGLVEEKDIVQVVKFEDGKLSELDSITKDQENINVREIMEKAEMTEKEKSLVKKVVLVSDKEMGLDEGVTYIRLYSEEFFKVLTGFLNLVRVYGDDFLLSFERQKVKWPLFFFLNSRVFSGASFVAAILVLSLTFGFVTEYTNTNRFASTLDMSKQTYTSIVGSNIYIRAKKDISEYNRLTKQLDKLPKVPIPLMVEKISSAFNDKRNFIGVEYNLIETNKLVFWGYTPFREYIMPVKTKLEALEFVKSASVNLKTIDAIENVKFTLELEIDPDLIDNDPA